jgi:hypothetical protein
MNQSTLSTDFTKLPYSAISLQTKPSPHTYLDKGVTNSQIHKRQTRRKLKSERLEIRYQTKSKLVDLLSSLGESDKAESMARCGQKLSVLTCGQHIVAKNPHHRCEIRYCPSCASRRSAKHLNKYLPAALQFVKDSTVSLTPCLLTFTQKKIKGERLIDSKRRMEKSFRNMIRHVFFREYFDGGVFAVENTFSDDGNHCHIHALVFRKRFIEAALLKQHWSKVSDGARNLNIQRVDSLENGLRECLKYISKPMSADNLRRSHVKELLELSGQKMLGSFGLFRKFCQTFEPPDQEIEVKEKLTEGQYCPCCADNNSVLFIVMMSDKDYIAFHRQSEQVRGSPPTKG